MQPSDYEHFTGMLNAIGELYGKPISEWMIGLWWGALQGYDLAAVREALSRHVKNPDSGQFMPKPADVVRMMKGTTIDAALHAWAKVDKAVRQVGTYRDVAFDDALIHRVLHDMGGWVALGAKSEDEWPFVAKEFEQRYRGYCMVGELPAYPPLLTGIAGMGNRREGFAMEVPMLVGNPSKAEQVMQAGTSQPLLAVQLAASAGPVRIAA